MDDLLSELNGIDDNGRSSNKKQDGSSSPLRPNPKYCSMVQPVPVLSASRRYAAAHVPRVTPRPAERPAPLSGANLTPVNEAKEQSWQNRGSASSSRIPEKTVTTVASSTMDGMEVDEDVPSTSNRSSSPLRPNEKYCSIVTPSNRRSSITARTSVQSERRESRSIAPPHFNNHTPSMHNRARDSPPHATRHSTHHSVSYSNHRPATHSSQEMDHEPISVQAPDTSRNSQPNHHNRGYWESQLSDRYSSQHGKSIDQIPNAGYSGEIWQRGNGTEKEVANQREVLEQRYLREKEERKLDLERRKRIEAEKMEQLRMERERRRREEEQLMKDRESQMKEQERLKMEAKYNRIDSQRESRYKRKIFENRPEQKEETVTAVQELEVLKARYKEEEEARKAEALERLVGCLDKIDERRKDEPEPMEVEESDTIESMVPARSAMLTIAPIPLIIKAEPVDDNLPREPMRVDEIPLPAGPPPAMKEDAAKGKDESEEKKDDEDLVIIEKPPVEMVTLSDDEGTVVSCDKEIKQEEGECSSKAAVVDDDLWIVGSKRGGNWKKKHVFDLSKVKKEKEDEQSMERPSSEKSATAAFDVTKVKSEPTATPAKDKEESSEVKKEPADEMASKGDKEDTKPNLDEVKKEPGEPIVHKIIPNAGGSTSRGDANTVSQSSTVDEESAQDREAFGPALPPGWSMADEAEQGTVQSQLLAQDPIEEPSREENVDPVNAALAAARRLIRTIGESVQQERQQQRRIRQRPPHIPVPGSFLHALRTTSRKRGQECDADEREDEWLHQVKNHPSPPGMCMWGARKRRRVEEDGKGTEKITKD